jgi:uncharacterized damage-inducible protein DinB
VFDRHTTLRLLRRSAHDLAREIEAMPQAAALWRPAEGEWSVHETLTHLWIAERFIFLPRLQRVAAEERPALPLVDEAAHHRRLWKAETPLADLLADFVTDRAQEVVVLERTADWSRIGVHEVRGPVSLAWLAEYTIGHTWEHLAQIMRARLAYHTRPA